MKSHLSLIEDARRKVQKNDRKRIVPHHGYEKEVMGPTHPVSSHCRVPKEASFDFNILIQHSQHTKKHKKKHKKKH